MDRSMEEAIRFIDGELKANPNASRAKIVEEACVKFNLDPKQTEFLVQKFVLET